MTVTTLPTVGQIITYLDEVTTPTHLALAKSFPMMGIAQLVDKVCKQFPGSNPFIVRVAVHVYVFNEEAPRRVIQMAIDEMSKMIDVAVTLPSQAVVMHRISIAIEVLNTLMDDPEFGGRNWS